MLRFRLLGDVDVRVAGQRIDVGPARQRCVLVALLVDANEIVTPDQLTERVWGDRRPQRVRETLYSYVSRLRQALSAASEVTLLRRSGGYVLSVDPATIDLHRFRDLVGRARETDDDGRALPLFDEALRLWHGDAFADLETPWLDLLRASLGRERFAAELDHADLAIRAGRHAALVPALVRRMDEHSLDERLGAQLMLALYRSGRPADALDHYGQVRRRLADALGVDPAPELRRLHLRILNTDPGLAGDAGPVRRARPRPSQLPGAVADFTGRRAAVTWAESVLTGPAEGLRVVAVSGAAGVGKSSFAWHVAHRLRRAFPDGQLYADLRGIWPESIEPGDVLARFLRSVGVPDAAQSATAEERGVQFRAAVADRRILVVLDDARSAAQVRPLLPGSASCAVIVTGRQRLTGLAGADHLVLETFEPEEARSLLERVVGADRVAAEPAAVAEIARRCGYLPLAVRIAAARLAARPGWRLAQLAERLRDEAGRLDELATDDLEVRASLGLGYRSLAEPGRRMLRLCGLLDAPDLPAWAGAALLDEPVARAERQLEALVDACLLTVVDRPEGAARYRMHDLVRLFARERAVREEPADLCRAALRRAFGAWLAFAEDADARLPTRTLAAIHGPGPRWRPAEPFAAVGDAAAWFDDERAALAAATRQAAALGFADVAWQLAARAHPFHDVRGTQAEARPMHQDALRACVRAGDRLGEAVMLRNLADLWTSRLDASVADKLDAARAALEIFRQVGEPRGVTDALLLSADVHRVSGRLREASELLAEASEVAAAAGHRVGECRALVGRATINREQGRDQVARELAERCVQLARKEGVRRDEGVALTILGACCCALGQPETGEAYLREGLAVARDLGDRTQETYTLARLGRQYATDRHPAARPTLELALARSQADGVAFGEALALSGFGELELNEGRPDRAVSQLRRAIQMLGDGRFPFARAQYLVNLGRAYAGCGDDAAAATAWTTAHGLYVRLGNGSAAERAAGLLAGNGPTPGDSRVAQAPHKGSSRR